MQFPNPNSGRDERFRDLTKTRSRNAKADQFNDLHVQRGTWVQGQR